MLTDYHIHNHFSPDSEEDTKRILDKAREIGLHEICITNHPELHDKKTGKGSFDPIKARSRFNKVRNEIDQIQNNYPEINIRFGIELEYVESWLKPLSSFVEESHFDFVLGSVHMIKGIIISSHKFADELYAHTDEKIAYNAYFDNLLKLIEWGHLDVVAHFDICKKYGSKYYGPFQPEKYKERIIPILERMKKKEIGLELNTKCMTKKCRELFPHPDILRWAVEVGIQHFTFGSDAHQAKDIGQHYKEALLIAQKAGVKSFSTYHMRQAI